MADDNEEKAEVISDATDDSEKKIEIKSSLTKNKKESDKIKSGEFDEDGALHISGVDVMGSTTREDWKGASLKLPRDAEPGVARAHVTCPHCAAKCTAGSGTCWNCGKPLHEA